MFLKNQNQFFQNFFPKCKRQSLESVHSENYSNLTSIFVLLWSKMTANQIKYFRLEQRSVIKFLMAKNFKLCEIYRRMSDVYWGVLVKNIYKWVKIGFAIIRLTQKESAHQWEWTDSSVKKKLWMRWLVKKKVLAMFWDMKGSIMTDLKEVQL